jgi:hypothetical protein
MTARLVIVKEVGALCTGRGLQPSVMGEQLGLQIFQWCVHGVVLSFC